MAQTESLTDRILHFLRREAEARGVKTAKGTEVKLDLTQQDIASLFGMTREEATRALNALKRSGVIYMEGSSIILAHPNNNI